MVGLAQGLIGYMHQKSGFKSRESDSGAHIYLYTKLVGLCLEMSFLLKLSLIEDKSCTIILGCEITLTLASS